MVQAMPSPFKHPKTGVYWYRQRTPKGVVSICKGKQCLIEVDGVATKLTIGDALKLSLRTKDAREAVRRAKDVQQQFDMVWDQFRHAPVDLNNKQIHALAGDIYRTFSQALEDEPGAPEIWQHVKELNAAALSGRVVPNPLAINKNIDPLEQRFGGFVDIALRRHGLSVSPVTRKRLLAAVANALQDAAELAERRAAGDYSPDANAQRFPEYRPTKTALLPKAETAHLTFNQIIDSQVEYRKAGVGAKYQPLREKSVVKYRRFCRVFSEFRASEFADTTTAAELEAWKMELLTRGELSARTTHDAIKAIKTVVNWAAASFVTHDGLHTVKEALARVELPGFAKKPSDVTSIHLDEATKVLKKAQQSSDRTIRWLPWLCAYTGARVGELAFLETADFRMVEGYPFFKISTKGGRKVKTEASVRYVPVHPALEREGFLNFVERQQGRLFAKNSEEVVRRWFKAEDGAGITRDGVSPNHGWRHLFEDICIRDGVSDTAKLYVTGRYEPGSAGDYGKTDARLSGLFREIQKIEPYFTEA